MKINDIEKNMHIHNFREITEYLEGNMDIRHSEDEILHVFECSCGFSLIEKRRHPKSSSNQKKTTIYIVLRK